MIGCDALFFAGSATGESHFTFSVETSKLGGAGGGVGGVGIGGGVGGVGVGGVGAQVDLKTSSLLLLPQSSLLSPSHFDLAQSEAGAFSGFGMENTWSQKHWPPNSTPHKAEESLKPA
jgi:hypothetical protein